MICMVWYILTVLRYIVMVTMVKLDIFKHYHVLYICFSSFLNRGKGVFSISARPTFSTSNIKYIYKRCSNYSAGPTS